jgi:hypothetical protein
MKASLQLDRREFLGNLILTIGGASVAAMVPFATVSSSAPATDICGDWNVDDVCGAYPPYAHPIPFGRPGLASDSLLANAEPADHIFLV